MTPAMIVTGTDTDVGKTVFAAALVAALDGYYWKPVQAGHLPESDSVTVRRLSGLPDARILSEAYDLSTPASPHLAAERDGVEVDVARLAKLPAIPADAQLIIEGAGGLLVPLTRRTLQIDVFARWNAPVVLVASTRLGTINHTLLSIEALRHRAIPLVGIAFVGDANEDSERTIAEISGARRLGRLPWLETLNAETLRVAFAESFDVGDFTAAPVRA
jgi:dethiobiotin synthetase